MDDGSAPVAAAVEAAWIDALGVGGPVDPDERFLSAGGHSLAAARLIARLAADLDVALPISAILRNDPSLAELVAAVADRPASGASAPVSAPGRVASRPGMGPEPATGSAPVAPTMRRIWTWHRLYPESPAYNVVRVLSVAGRVQPSALRAALADLGARHEALRCAVVEPRPGQPEVLVGDPVAVPLTVEVVRPDEIEPMAAVDAALYRIADRPFPMATPPLWRAGLVYAPTLGRTWLIVVMHHLISDLRASDVVLADLAVAYASRAGGGAPTFATAAPKLLDHLRHEWAQPGTPRWTEQLDWWSRRLAAAGSAAPLPLSAADRGEQVFAGSTQSRSLAADESDALDRSLRAERLTPAIFFLTAASAVLAAWRGQDRPEVLGLPSARMGRPEDEGLIGFRLDTLLLPVSVTREQDFLSAYAAVRDAYADAADHALPVFDDIVNRLRLPRSARTPLIRLWFNDLTQANPPSRLGDEPAVEYDLPPAWALFDLGLYLWRSPAGYRLHLVTPRGLVRPADLAALLDQILQLAVRAGADPDASLADLLEPPAAPGPAAPGPTPVDSTVDLLRAHGRNRPEAVAVSDQDGALDYRSLDAEVGRYAAGLRDAAGPGAVVAVPARRDRQFLVRLLACARAGATAVLVDAGWPDRRRRRGLELAAVTHAYPWSGDGPSRAVGRPANTRPDGGDRAQHVLFTSGTTGDPLAVRVSTAVADRAIAELADRLGLGPGDRVSLLSGPAHDPVLRDLGLALRTGATVCIPPPEVFTEPAGLGRWLRRQRITVVNATPTLLALALSADPAPLPDLRAVVCGGAPLPAAVAVLIRSRATAAVVVNGYGCTETPQLVAALEIAPGQPLPPFAQIPIGPALPGRRVEIRAPDGRRRAVGQVGEVWVAKPHIAERYLGPEVAGGFSTDADGVRWLRTGDLARRDAAGCLHLAGRADRQVLLNGYRVNLEEIESVARGCPGVTDAVAQIIGDDGGQAVRVWVQCPAAAPVIAEEVRTHLAAVLPASVVPARVLVVDRLAVSENLKPLPPVQEPASAPTPGGAPLDRRLHELAESMLGGALDPATNFFDAGFTSASLLQLTAELADMLGHPVDALSVFQHPNLLALNALLFGPAPTAPSPAPVLDDTVAARSDRLARMRSARRDVRAWIQESAAPASGNRR